MGTRCMPAFVRTCSSKRLTCSSKRQLPQQGRTVRGRVCKSMVREATIANGPFCGLWSRGGASSSGVDRLAPGDPGVETLAHVVCGAHAGKLLPFDLEPFRDAHVEPARHRCDDARRRQ